MDHRFPSRLLALPLPMLAVFSLIQLACLAKFSAEDSAALVRPSIDNNPLGNPPNMVDRLVMIDTPEALGQGTRAGVNLVVETPARLLMVEPANRTYPRRGTWTSDENKTD